MSTMTITRPVTPSVALGPARPVHPRPSAARHEPARLTRRGRLVLFLLALMTVLSLGVVWGSHSVASEHAGTPEPTRTVMVGPGDTLWAIAADIADDGEVRAMVDRIERLNALDTAELSAGQLLRVPTSG